MKSILLSVISFLLVMNVCGKNDVDMRTYLKKVLGNLGKIESASYHEQSQSWQPGDIIRKEEARFVWLPSPFRERAKMVGNIMASKA